MLNVEMIFLALKQSYLSYLSNPFHCTIIGVNYITRTEDFKRKNPNRHLTPYIYMFSVYLQDPYMLLYYQLVDDLLQLHINDKLLSEYVTIIKSCKLASDT